MSQRHGDWSDAEAESLTIRPFASVVFDPGREHHFSADVRVFLLHRNVAFTLLPQFVRCFIPFSIFVQHPKYEVGYLVAGLIYESTIATASVKRSLNRFASSRSQSNSLETRSSLHSSFSARSKIASFLTERITKNVEALATIRRTPFSEWHHRNETTYQTRRLQKLSRFFHR